MAKNKAAVSLGKKGGLATKKRMGKDYYSKIGKLGAAKRNENESKKQTA